MNLRNLRNLRNLWIVLRDPSIGVGVTTGTGSGVQGAKGSGR
jgi:hypothetical protein